jgi:hypothetical protein
LSFALGFVQAVHAQPVPQPLTTDRTKLRQTVFSLQSTQTNLRVSLSAAPPNSSEASSIGLQFENIGEERAADEEDIRRNCSAPGATPTKFNVLKYHYDSLRTGWNNSESVLDN